MPARTKKKMGAPTKYRPEYCDLVVEMGQEGKSLAQMAARIGVAKQSLNDWEKVHPDFSSALARARTEMQAALEQKGYDGMGDKSFNAHLWVKTMAARFREDYTERKELTGKDGDPLSVAEDPRAVARAVLDALGDVAVFEEAVIVEGDEHLLDVDDKVH